MWNPFNRKPKLKIGDLVLGYKYSSPRTGSVSRDPEDALGCIVSIEKELYTIQWCDNNIPMNKFDADLVHESRERYINSHYCQQEKQDD